MASMFPTSVSIPDGFEWGAWTAAPGGSVTGGLQYNAGSGVMAGTTGVTTDGLAGFSGVGSIAAASGGLTISTTGGDEVSVSAGGGLQLANSTHILPNADVAGTVTVPSGQTSMTFTFATVYGGTPVVVLTPASGAWDTFTKFWVGAVAGSFTVFVDAAPASDYTFNYMVMAPSVISL